MDEENKNLSTTENDGEQSAFSVPQRKPGGLYRNVKMSVKTANILVLVGIAALVVVTLFLVNHNGFTVTFDTDGGSSVESVKLYYGDTVTVDETPTKEGYVFTGWYYDKDCTAEWNLENDIVTGSFTLYAGWEEAG